MREAYALVREHLKVVAERNKRTYDLRVRTRQYQVGDWVYYFNPRKLVGRQDKWRRKYTGPFLVTKVIGPVNVTLQRSKRAHPFCTHVDKLKPYGADVMPASWLQGRQITLLQMPMMWMRLQMVTRSTTPHPWGLWFAPSRGYLIRRTLRTPTVRASLVMVRLLAHPN